MDYYRTASRRHEIPAHPPHDREGNTGAGESAASLHSEKQTFHQYDLAQACLTPLIARLPEPYREAIRLVEIDGLPQRDLSERFAVSLSGAKSRVQRGRDKLKDLLLHCCQVELDKRGNVMDYHPEAEGCGSVTSATTSSVAQTNLTACPCAQPKEGRHERATL
jgi:RNA polymerase sigma-70 factor, ECF subfamily